MRHRELFSHPPTLINVRKQNYVGKLSEGRMLPFALRDGH